MIEAHALPYILVLLVGSALAFALVIYAARHRTLHAVTPFMWLCLAVAVWVALYAGEVAAVGQDAKIGWATVEYIPIALTPLCWLAFALHYSGQQTRVTRRMWLLLGLIPALTIGLIFTNDAHHLIWQRVT